MYNPMRRITDLLYLGLFYAPEGGEGAAADPPATDPAADADPPADPPGDPKDSRVKELSDEAARHRREKAAEKKRADDLQARLDAIEGQNKTDLQKAQDAAAAKDKEAQTLAGQARTLALENAFLREAHSYDLVDLDGAFVLADLKDVEIVDGKASRADIKKALDKLVKDKPYLKKQETGGQGPSGAPFNQRTNGNGSLDETYLKQKYQALNR